MSDNNRAIAPLDWRQQADDEKLRAFLARFPSAESLGRFLDEHEALVEEAERRKWLFSFTKAIAMWIAAVAAAIAVIRGFWADIGGGGTKP